MLSLPQENFSCEYEMPFKIQGSHEVLQKLIEEKQKQKRAIKTSMVK